LANLVKYGDKLQPAVEISDEASDYLLRRLKSQYPSQEFMFGDAMALTDMDVNETVQMLYKLKRERKVEQIDSVNHLARWRWIA
jgi:hypothetical protein